MYDTCIKCHVRIIQRLRNAFVSGVVSALIAIENSCKFESRERK